MSHVDSDSIHAYASRGLDIRVSVETAEVPADFTDITFRVGVDVVEKTGLTPTDTTLGFDVDMTLTAADMAIAARVYIWELLATFGGEVRTLAKGFFTVEPEPTS